MTIKEIAKYFGLSSATIKSACEGRQVKHSGPNYDLSDFKKKLGIK